MIDFTGANQQNINFGQFSGIHTLTQKTVIMTVNYDVVSTQDTYGIILANGSSTDATWSFGADSVAGGVAIEVVWGAGAVLWFSGSVISSGNWYQLAYTYDYSSSDNNPVLYVNGSATSVTKIGTTSGGVPAGTGSSLYLGDPFADATFHAMDGKMANVLIYNRIFSAAEILDAYNSRLAIPSYNGLVFAPDLRGAAGGVGDGSTLAAGNVIRDHISGASGVPAGSPVLRADTYLNYK
jgi:hypothetical protein